MREITKEMLHIYTPLSNLDWMNYKLVPRELTAHHILKREKGGMLKIPNIALLMRQAHEYLHIIEYKDTKTYDSLNKLFKYINNQRYEPTEEQRQIIEYLLCGFESEHLEDTNHKGNRIIKSKYLRRWK